MIFGIMKIREVAFTGYPVTDLDRARQFYEGVLGLEVSMEHGCDGTAWVEYELPCGVLAISNVVPTWKPAPDGPSIALEVEDIQGAVKELEAAGVAMPAGLIESPVCWILPINDPDGNSLMLHQRKPGQE